MSGHLRGPGEKEPRLSFFGPVPFPFLVLEIFEGGPGDPHRLLGAERLQGFSRLLEGVLDRLVRHVGLGEVVEQLRVDPLEPPGIPALEEVGILPVERLPLPPGEMAVENVAHDAAREDEPVSARLPLLLENSLLDERVDGVLEVGTFDERLQLAELEAAPEDRGDGEDLPQVLREPLDPGLDGLLNRLGEGVGRDSGRPREIQCARVVGGDAARIDERPDQLLREEGVSLGRVEEACREAVRKPARAGHLLREGPVLGGGERPEGDRGEAGVAAERLEHPDEGVPLVDLRLPVGPDDERRRRAEAPDDVLERLDRELRAVQFLEDEEEGPAAADPRERPGDQLEDRDPIFGLPPLGPPPGRRVPRGRPEIRDLGEDGEEREEVRGEVREVRAGDAGAPRVAGPEVVLDQLAKALVREGAVVLDEPPLEDGDLPGPPERFQLVEEARLPDPRFARHDGELALAGDGAMEAPLQLGQLLFASDERRRRCGARQDPARGQDDGARVLVLVKRGAEAAEGFGDVAGPARPLFRVLLEALEQDLLEPFCDVDPHRAKRRRHLVRDPVEDGLNLARERRLSGETLVEDRPEGIDVRTAVERPGGDLLGAEVGHRPDERSRLREPVLGGGEREAEVHDAGSDAAPVLARRHDVLGLDVPVDDAAGVAVVEALGNLDADVENVPETERPVAEEMPEVRPRQHGHDEEESPLVPAEVVDRNDGRVVHLRDDLGFPLEPFFGVLRQVSGRDQLDRDLAVQDGVLRAVDDSHPATAQLGEDLVPVREARPDHRQPCFLRFA